MAPRHHDYGYIVSGTRNGRVHRSQPILFSVSTNGSNQPDLRAYCLELGIPATHDSFAYVSPWDEFQGNNSFKNSDVQQKVGWIVLNSYPNVELDKLAQTVGIVDGLTNKVAIAATQSAIWHLTDGLENPQIVDAATSQKATNAEKAAFQALYGYLIGSENIGISEGDVQASVEIKADNIEGNIGETLGPVRIESAQNSISVTLNGDIVLVDANGDEIDPTTIDPRTEFYVKHNQTKEDSVSGSIHSYVNVTGYNGKLITPPAIKSQVALTSAPTGGRGQALIIVEEKRDAADSAAHFTWKRTPTPTSTPTPEPTPTPTPTPEAPKPKLVHTGASVGILAILGFVAVGSGALLVRRSRA
ncbi:TQXA domain-containing protein [Trueperella bonasi]|uniref:TQXA domain-containing protein n=1 Tax=Trueperella bonasi TaxID=312286 RepID=A0ABT9NGV0_9ACTO|nr:TQXA domain-containing protein [Trueperella bonasi]